MSMPDVKILGTGAYSITTLQRSFLVMLVSEDFGLCADTETMAHLLDAHILEVRRVHLHQIFAINIIACKALAMSSLVYVHDNTYV